MRSAAANHEDTYADMSFREAAKLVCKAWRRKHKILCLPLSHALSDHIDGIWTIRDSEVGGLRAEWFSLPRTLKKALDWGGKIG